MAHLELQISSHSVQTRRKLKLQLVSKNRKTAPISHAAIPDDFQYFLNTAGWRGGFERFLSHRSRCTSLKAPGNTEAHEN